MGTNSAGPGGRPPGTSRRTLALAIALVMPALGASACTSGGNTAATSAGPVASARTAAKPGLEVTAARARQVFGQYVTSTDRALTAGDAKGALALTDGTARDELDYALKSATRRHAKAPAPSYGAPAFILPRQTGYPEWFIASVPRTAAAPRTVSGIDLPARGQALMVFERKSARQPWRLTSSAQLPPGQELPELARTAGGDARYVPLSDQSALARPDVAGALQAAVVGDGPSSPAAQAVAGGPLTTGLYSYLASPPPVYRQPPGDVRQWSLSGSKYDRFALRLADGGALVFYAMYLNSVTEVPAELSKSASVPPGPPIAIPPEFGPLLPPGARAPRTRLLTQYALSFAAIDPPASAESGKIQVIAASGAPKWVMP